MAETALLVAEALDSDSVAAKATAIMLEKARTLKNFMLKEDDR